jgi:hypothetical protein
LAVFAISTPSIPLLLNFMMSLYMEQCVSIEAAVGRGAGQRVSEVSWLRYFAKLRRENLQVEAEKLYFNLSVRR